MKRSLLVLVLAATPAAAEIARAPQGFQHDATMSVDLTRKAQRGSYFGGIPSTNTEVIAFVAPAGSSLYVTRIEANPAAELRGAAATRALFELVDSARRQGSAEIEASSQRADTANKLLEASIAWRDPSLGIRELGRTIVAGDAQRLVAITGECIFPIEVAAELERACAATLAALDHDIALDQRVALAMIEAPAETTLPSIATAPPEAPAGPTRTTEQPRLDDGRRTSMTPMTIAPAKREADRRPIYLGGGIIVLAAVFWWNRQRRDRFDREDEPDKARTAPAPEPSSGDDDADDLQAAARGEAPKDES